MNTNRKQFVPDRPYIAENRNFTNHSEAIAQFIIEKLISYSISEAYRREVEGKIPTHCWSFMHQILDNFVKLEFIAHDRDDIDEVDFYTLGDQNNLQRP